MAKSAVYDFPNKLDTTRSIIERLPKSKIDISRDWSPDDGNFVLEGWCHKEKAHINNTLNCPDSIISQSSGRSWNNDEINQSPFKNALANLSEGLSVKCSKLSSTSKKRPRIGKTNEGDKNTTLEPKKVLAKPQIQHRHRRTKTTFEVSREADVKLSEKACESSSSSRESTLKSPKHSAIPSQTYKGHGSILKGYNSELNYLEEHNRKTTQNTDIIHDPNNSEFILKPARPKVFATHTRPLGQWCFNALIDAKDNALKTNKSQQGKKFKRPATVKTRHGEENIYYKSSAPNSLVLSPREYVDLNYSKENKNNSLNSIGLQYPVRNNSIGSEIGLTNESNSISNLDQTKSNSFYERHRHFSSQRTSSKRLKLDEERNDIQSSILKHLSSNYEMPTASINQSAKLTNQPIQGNLLAKNGEDAKKALNYLLSACQIQTNLLRKNPKTLDRPSLGNSFRVIDCLKRTQNYQNSNNSKKTVDARSLQSSTANNQLNRSKISDQSIDRESNKRNDMMFRLRKVANYPGKPTTIIGIKPHARKNIL